MRKMRDKSYEMKAICSFVGISRQAYHKRVSRSHSKNKSYDDAEKTVIAERRIRTRAGLRTIYHKANMVSLLGINDFEKEMSARGHALKPYRSYLKTTDSRGHYNKFENRIAGMKVNSPNQVVVGDITYYQGINGLYYIFQFQDFYTLEIKGLYASNNMEGINAEKCFRQVLNYNNKQKYNYMTFLHTDAGSQYRSHKFQQLLHNAQVLPSHAKSCFENGLAERTNGILKNEYLLDYEIKSISQLNKILKKIKREHNQIWPSAKLDYKTPAAYAAEIMGIKKSLRPVKIVKEVL